MFVGLQDKLEPSEQLGDLLRRAGDNDAALAVYQKANVPGKVIEGLAAKGDFEALSKFRCAVLLPYVHLPRLRDNTITTSQQLVNQSRRSPDCYCCIGAVLRKGTGQTTCTCCSGCAWTARKGL